MPFAAVDRVLNNLRGSMRNNLLTICLVVATVGACGESRMAGDVVKENSRKLGEANSIESQVVATNIPEASPRSIAKEEPTGNQNAEPVAAPEVPPPSIDGASDSAPQTAEALPPVSIGGAYLYCHISEHKIYEAECLAKDAQGNPSSFNAERAYILSGNPVQWMATTFSKDPSVAGRWLIATNPAGSKNFGIALANRQNQILADWIVESGNPPPLALKDGSFENQKVDVSSAEAMHNTQYRTADAQGAWKARPSRNSECTIGTLEVQSLSIAATMGAAQNWTADDGEQWIELDSACGRTTTAAKGGNMAVYQDLSLSVGHIYEISFAYKRRPIDTNLERFTARLGDSLLLDKTVTISEWTEYKALRKASKNVLRLEFEELGLEDGVGTLIDNVRVIDLGTGP